MIKVGLVGCGNMGLFIARHIDKKNGLKLVSVLDVNKDNIRDLLSKIKNKPRVAANMDELLKGVDVVVEAASQEVVRKSAIKILKKGKNLVIMSVGALTDKKLLGGIRIQAERNNCLVYLPSGAICGIDGVKSACVGKVHKVILKTTKPPKALIDVKYLKDRKINLKKIKKPRVLYSGSALNAAKLFPKNINVSTVLGLAGVGLNRTKVEIIADPSIKSNLHEIFLEGESGTINIKLVNKPSPNNIKTSYLACLSVVRLLDDMNNNIKIGN